MIVSIIDIVGSTRIDPRRRKSIFQKIDLEMESIRKTWSNVEMAGPQRIQSDTIELASNHWLMHVQLIHFLLTQKIKIYVGVGAYRVHIWDPNDINKCDGPAFWNARKALEEAKKIAKRGKPRYITYIFHVEPDIASTDLQNIASITTYVTWICRVRRQSRQYLYEYIWRSQSINQIAEKYKTTPQNISQIINKNMAQQLRRIVERIMRSLTSH